METTVNRSTFLSNFFFFLSLLKIDLVNYLQRNFFFNQAVIFEKALQFSKVNQHAESLLQDIKLSQERVTALKGILYVYWLDSQTEEQKRQMIFAANVLLGRKGVSLDAEDYAIIELVSKEEFFDEAWASVIYS